MDYRLCKNKYGYYKIQRLVYEEKEEDHQTLWELFLSTCSLGAWQPKDYHWVNTWDQKVYKTKKEAVAILKELADEERVRLEKTHDSWVCGEGMD